MSKLFKEVKPFRNVKLAMLNVEAKDASKWSALVNDYLIDKFPELSSGIRPVNFQAKDPEVGSAVGSAEYRDGSIAFTIPIFIEDFQLKEPDIALAGKRVIAIDMGQIKSLGLKSQEDGVMTEHPEEDDITDQTEFITSLFETTDADQDGNPMYFKGAKEISEKVAEVYDSLYKADDVFSDRVKSFIRCPNTIYEKEDIIKVALEEMEENPYHYRCVILKKVGGDLKHDYAEDVSETELKALNSRVIKEADFVSFNPKDADPPKIKNIEEPGEYDIYFKDSIVRVPVFTNIFTIENTASRNIKPLAIIDSMALDMGSTEAVFNSNELLAEDKLVTDKKKGWIFDKMYGIKYDDMMLGEKGRDGTWLELEGVDDIQDHVGEDIVFCADGGKMSSPYKVIKAEGYALGEKREKISVIDVESYASKKVLSLWLKCQVDRPLKANKNKMQHNQYKAVSDTTYPLWMIPAQYRIMLLPGNREISIKPRDYYGKYFKNEFGKYDKELILTTSNYNPTKVDIAIKEEEKDPIIVSEVGKVAADLYVQHFMGRDDIVSEDLQKGKGYLISKVASDPEFKEYPDVESLKEYRGEWMKLAYVLLKNKDVVKYSKAVKDDGQILKKAELESLVDDLIGLEYVDNDNIGNTNDIEYNIEDIIDKTGQLLLLSRIGKNDIPENILMRSIKALTKLLNEIRGNDSGAE